jgi:hypothetical protein
MLDQKMIAQIGAACEHGSRNALKVLGALLKRATDIEKAGWIAKRFEKIT